MAGVIEGEIADGETVFRGVPNDESFFPLDVSGLRRISSIAFNDKRREPSVDRAALRRLEGPTYTQKGRGPESGVLQITAGQIRSLSTTKGDTGETYTADVRSDALPDNPAHCVIFGKPPFDTDKVFERIKKSLAREAVWAILPGLMRDS